MAERRYGLANQIAVTMGHAKLSPSLVSKMLMMGELPESFIGLLDTLKAKYPAFPLPTREHWDRAERDLGKTAGANIVPFSILDPEYPATLRVITDPPPVLYAKGNLKVFQHLPGVAIVGTRAASSLGKTIARRLGLWATENKWIVVSGLALGIDAAAHEGALIGHGKTIAVLAHGLEEASPKANAGLADEILIHGGLWVSEHPAGTTPRKEYFVQRNRIQIGLSAGSIIVEGEIRSGSMTQAQFCIRERRALFAVTPDDRARTADFTRAGPETLVREGKAFPIITRQNYGEMQRRLLESRERLTGIPQRDLWSQGATSVRVSKPQNVRASGERLIAFEISVEGRQVHAEITCEAVLCKLSEAISPRDETTALHIVGESQAIADKVADIVRAQGSLSGAPGDAGLPIHLSTLNFP